MDKACSIDFPGTAHHIIPEGDTVSVSFREGEGVVAFSREMGGWSRHYGAFRMEICLSITDVIYPITTVIPGEPNFILL